MATACSSPTTERALAAEKPKKEPSVVFLSLGSNLGEREQLIRQAIGLIAERIGSIVRQSSIIETEPWGYTSPHPFLNAAVMCLTSLSPQEVLQQTQAIERQLGKSARHATLRGKTTRYRDRPIDIDILLYDDLHLQTPELTIPHPHMHERDFVMIPLNEILNNQ